MTPKTEAEKIEALLSTIPKKNSPKEFDVSIQKLTNPFGKHDLDPEPQRNHSRSNKENFERTVKAQEDDSLLSDPETATTETKADPSAVEADLETMEDSCNTDGGFFDSFKSRRLHRRQFHRILREARFHKSLRAPRSVFKTDGHVSPTIQSANEMALLPLDASKVADGHVSELPTSEAHFTFIEENFPTLAAISESLETEELLRECSTPATSTINNGRVTDIPSIIYNMPSGKEDKKLSALHDENSHCFPVTTLSVLQALFRSDWESVSSPFKNNLLDAILESRDDDEEGAANQLRQYKGHAAIANSVVGAKGITLTV
jgi:hypothetical protein